MLSNATLPTTRMDMDSFRSRLVFAQQQIQLAAGCCWYSFGTGEDGGLQRGSTGTSSLTRHGGHRSSHSLGGVGRVLMQHRDHLVDRDRVMPFVPAVVVGDHG